MNIKPLFLYTTLISLLILSSGCSLINIQKEAEKVESAGRIQGKIKRVSQQQGPIIIHRYSLNDTTLILESLTRVSIDGDYFFDALPGSYYISAFVDNNRDNEYQENEDANFLHTSDGRIEEINVVTGKIAQAGMSSAGEGVKHSPIVLPVWRDLEPNSEFLQDLNSWAWPKDIPFHLIFSYVDGHSNDTVVPLQSQTPLKVQLDAVRMYGFNNSHVGTLHDKDFSSLFHSILAGTLKP